MCELNKAPFFKMIMCNTQHADQNLNDNLN